MMTHTPTTDSYPELETAYDHFNKALFGGQLPAVLITLQRKSTRVMGYFSPDRFVHKTGKKTDELAMNPSHFLNRDLMDTLSTLAHEMTHVWQQHFGKPGRRGYHNKAWGVKMKEIGLHPSKTGKPGGKETGEQMTHYVMAGGRFELSAKALLDAGFNLSWAEYAGEIVSPAEPVEGGTKTKKSLGRVKFICPKCGNKAWGRPTLRLGCVDCMVQMLA